MGNSQSSDLTAALKNGDGSFVQQALAACAGLPERAKLLTATTGLLSGKKTILHTAAKQGHAGVMSSVLAPLVDAVTAEIEEGVYPGSAAQLLGRIVNKQDGMGRTPLLTACLHGHWDCADLLLEAGSNVFACDKDGNGVLHLAAIHSHQHVVQQLLLKADAQAVTGRLASTLNLSGFTPLHYAAWAGASDIVRRLLAAGVDQLQASWGEYDRWLVVPQGSTALHVAAVHSRTSACISMLEHYALLVREWAPGAPTPVDPRTKVDCQGNTPLQSAVWKGSIAPDCQLAMCLNPRIDIRSIFHADSLQAVAELRQQGPRPLRVIAAEAAKHHLLQQLAALDKQQRLLRQQQQQLQQQQRHSDVHLHLQQKSKTRLLSSSSSHACSSSGAATIDIGFLPRLCPGSLNGTGTTVSSSSSSKAAKPPLHPDSRRSSNASGSNAAVAGKQQSPHASCPGNASSGQLHCRTFDIAVCSGSVPGPNSLTDLPGNTAEYESSVAGCGSLNSITTALQQLEHQQQHQQQQQEHQQGGLGLPVAAPAGGKAGHCEIEPACEDDAVAAAASAATVQAAAAQAAVAGCEEDGGAEASLLVQLHAPCSLVGRKSNAGFSSSSSSSSSIANLAPTPPKQSFGALHSSNSSPARACASNNSNQSLCVSEIACFAADVSSRGPRDLGNVSISGLSHVSHASGSFFQGSAGSIHNRRSSLELPPSAAGPSMSVVFGANKQQVAEMLQEAGTADPGMLSYKSLTSHRRTGSLSFATSLAGALPGCVSDKLVHCLDSSSFIHTHVGVPGSAASSTTGSAAAAAVLSVARSVSLGADSSCGSIPGDVCAVCMDKQPGVVLAGCGHVLCLDCARCIVQDGVGCRAPLCPFCRMNITGFGLAAAAVSRE